MAAGKISTQAASAIIRMLDPVAVRARRDDLDRGEKLLVEQAAGLTFDPLSKLLLRAQAWLDPDGVAPAKTSSAPPRRCACAKTAPA